MAVIEPYFNRDGITLYQGDCLAILPQLEPGSVDAVVTSPPYDDLRTYNGNVNSFVFEPLAQELFRVIKIGGIVVWIVGDGSINYGESGNSFRQVLYFMNIGFTLHDTMIYMKSGPAYPSQDKYYQVFEYMFILSKEKPKTVNLIKDRENRWYGEKWSKVRTRRKNDGTLIRQSWNVNEGEKLGIRFNIWQYANGYGNHGDDLCHEHPASFPEELALDHILSWSNPNDLILDPMMGSCTTGKMARKTGRRFIGIEINEKYCQIAQKRIEQALMQPRLFDLEPKQKPKQGGLDL